jgi:hypothetical protein
MVTPALQLAQAPVRFRNLEVIAVSAIFLAVSITSPLFLHARVAWLLVAVCMIAFLLFLGRWISGRPLGVLINERNLISLSRFQMVSWPVLLLSAFFVIAMARLHASSASPLNIMMDCRLWALMGISATSLVGTPLILSSKTSEAAETKTIDKAARALNEPAAEVQANSQGTLYSNAKIGDASLTDMFQGDEVGNTAYVDLSKVQMFYFTIIAVIAYACALYSVMPGLVASEKASMPVPSDALVALLGISHAAYLTSKANQHS